MFNYPVDTVNILLRRSHQTARQIIDASLLLLIVANLFVVYASGSSVAFEPLAWFAELFLSSNRVFGLFWFLLIFNVYFLYRIFRESSAKHSIAANGTIKGVMNIADVCEQPVLAVLDRVWNLAATARQLPVRPLHLMMTLLEEHDSEVVLARLGMPINQVHESLLRQSAYYNPGTGSLDSTIADIFLNAYAAAVIGHSKKVRVSDVLLATVMADETIQQIFYDHRIDTIKVANVTQWINFNHDLVTRYRRYRSKSAFKPKGPINRSYTSAATPFLDSFSTDLTAAARAGQLPLTVARDKEMEEAFRVMESGRSVVLVGEKGVGKTNMIGGLANRMVAEEVPKMFQDKRLVALSLPFLVAGASQTGEVQERLLMVIQEIIRAGNIILVIQDVHSLIGVSSAGTENVDLSQVLSQQVRNGVVHIIATTTPQAMAEYVAPSPLSEVLERVPVQEPEKNSAIQILEANVGYAEAQHKVFFTYEALDKLIDLSDRYLHDQFLPAKAISLMTEAAAWVATREGKLITGEDIAALVSKKTNIPLTQVTRQESEVLMNLDAVMHERVIGQEEAVQFVVSALRRARAELRDTKRPIVNLLFMGPTGVGKTELAKTVAASYFGNENAMIRLDMSEYQAADSIARLIGVPGSNKGGVLTEAVRARPFALLLLDEIEKAHAEILNVFLQVMDDGRLTDALGHTIDFTNTIIVATSNAGANYIQDEIKKNSPIERIKEGLLKGDVLRDIFRPEFLNRFDGIVVFKPLTADEIYQVAGLMIKAVAKRMEDKGIALTVTPAAQKELAVAGFDQIYGARPLRRVVQERVEEALANYLLKGAIGRRDTVVLDVGGKITVQKAERL